MSNPTPPPRHWQGFGPNDPARHDADDAGLLSSPSPRPGGTSEGFQFTLDADRPDDPARTPDVRYISPDPRNVPEASRCAPASTPKPRLIRTPAMPRSGGGNGYPAGRMPRKNKSK